MLNGDRTALVVVDMLNSYDHEDAEKLVGNVERALPHVVELLDAARERDVLTVYVNDNLEDWALDRTKLLERAMSGPHGPKLVEPIAPREDVAFIVKGRHSIFWETPLAYLLRRHEVGRLVLCGQVTEQCILYSALDAHIRHFDIVVAKDACAPIDEELEAASFRLMAENMHARVVPAAEALDEPSGD